MSSSNNDTFNVPLTFSNDVRTAWVPGGEPCDIIAFLAAIQELKVDLLPMTWESARPQVGRGRTSQVSQALLTAHTSFAFKRTSIDRTSRDCASEVYGSMINEVRILCHHPVKTDPNIVTLQGICWEFGSANATSSQNERLTSAEAAPGADQVWPVLVFEKSQFGDLYHFVSTEVGKELGLETRLAMSKQIAQAVLHMHSYGKDDENELLRESLNAHSTGIIHGDIKPENVLVFRDKGGGGFHARLADFGFSTWYADEDDHLVLPRTRPWHAPEHTFSGTRLVHARKMDIFSTALLLLWLIGQPYLLHHDRVAEIQLQTCAQEIPRDPVLSYLEECKDRDGLVRLAHNMITAESDLDLETRLALIDFFSVSLTSDPGLRDTCMKPFERILENQQEQSKPLDLPQQTLGITASKFEIGELMYNLYLGDYRLRRYITNALERRVLMSPASPLAFQLSLCFKLGFGCTRNQRIAEELLIRSGRSDTEIRDRLSALKEVPRWGGPVTIFRDLSWEGVLGHMITAEYYSQQNCLEEAELVLRRDLSALEHVFDENHVLVSISKRLLVYLLTFSRKWTEVERLSAQVIQALEKTSGMQYEVLMANVEMASIYKHQGRLLEAENLQKRSLQAWQHGWQSVCGESHPDVVAIMAGLASIQLLRGQWTEAEQLQSQVVRFTEQRYGQDHPDTLRHMSNLAGTFAQQGRWLEAGDLRLKITQISKRALGSNDLITLLSQAELTVLYSRQGRWSDSEKLLLDVIRQKERNLGCDHPRVLTDKSNLASTYTKQGRWAEAENLQKQVSETTQEVFGDRHPDTILDLSNLAQIYARQARWTEAERLQIRVAEVNKEILGEAHSTTLFSIANLSATYMNQGRWTDAEELQQQVVQLSHKALGSDHPDTLTHMSNLAGMHTKLGRLTKAEQLLSEVFQKQRQTLGDHPDTFHSMGNLAVTYARQGRYNEAELLQLEVVEHQKQMLGAEHPDVLGSTLNLAVIYAEQGRCAEAEQLQLRLTKTSSATLGDEHATTLHIKGQLAATCHDQKRWGEAQPLQMEVMQKRHRMLGPNHPDTLSSMSELADTYTKQELWEKAEPLRVQVLQRRRQVLGHDHPDARVSLGKLAITYANQGRWDEAAPLQLEATQRTQEALGLHHPDTITSISNLAAIYKHQGRRKEAERILRPIRSGPKCGAPSTTTKISSLFITIASKLGISKAEAARKRDD